MLCPNCGTILPDDSRFCTECGAAMNDAQPNAPVYTADPLSFSVPDVPPVIEPVAPFTGLESDAPDDPEESAPQAASQAAVQAAPRPDDPASDDPFAAFNAAAAASGLVTEAPPPYTAPSYEPHEPKVPNPDASREPSSDSYASDAAPASDGYAAPASGYSVPGGGYSAPLPPASGKKKSGKAGVIITLVVIVAVIAAAAAFFTAKWSTPESRPQATIVQSENSGSLTEQFQFHGQDGQEQEPDAESDSGLRGAFLPGGSK